jgi:hypothetical protein
MLALTFSIIRFMLITHLRKAKKFLFFAVHLPYKRKRRG